MTKELLLLESLVCHADKIMESTLSNSVTITPHENDGIFWKTWDVNGVKVTLGIEKV